MPFTLVTQMVAKNRPKFSRRNAQCNHRLNLQRSQLLSKCSASYRLQVSHQRARCMGASIRQRYPPAQINPEQPSWLFRSGCAKRNVGMGIEIAKQALSGSSVCLTLVALVQPSNCITVAIDQCPFTGLAIAGGLSLAPNSCLLLYKSYELSAQPFRATRKFARYSRFLLSY